MIPIRSYKSFWEGVRDKLDAGYLLWVHNESELSEKVRDIIADQLILVVVIPSSDTSETDKDNLRDISSGLVFAVIKTDSRILNADKDLEIMERAQNAVYGIKYLLHKEATVCAQPLHSYFENTNFGSMHADPEKNLLGCNGYSLSFNVTDVKWTLSEAELVALFPDITEDPVIPEPGSVTVIDNGIQHKVFVNGEYTCQYGPPEPVRDSIITNTDGAVLATVAAGDDAEIGDITVTKYDGSTYTHPAGKNLTETDSKRMVFQFPATYDDVIEITVSADEAGTYNNNEFTNVDSAVYLINTVETALPFTVVENDVLNLTITRTNNALASKVKTY